MVDSGIRVSTNTARQSFWLMGVIAFVVILGACNNDSDSDSNIETEVPTSVSTTTDDQMSGDMDMSMDEDVSDGMNMSTDDGMAGDMDMSTGDSETTDDPAKDPFIRRAVNVQASGFSLTDQNGETAKLSDYRGKWIVMDWIYTSCMTVCPALTGEMIRVRDGLGDKFGSQVQFLSLTFDPERDDAETLREYAQNVDADSDSWAWLTGSKSDTDAVAQSFGVSYSPAEAMMGVAMFDHTALTIIVDPAGRERFHYYGVGWSEDMIETLEILVPENTVFDRSDSGESFIVDLNEKGEELLATATSYYWQEFELEEGITNQSAHNFSGSAPAKRYFNARMDGLEEHGWTNLGKEDENGEVYGLYYMFKKSDDEFLGVGTEENVLVEVQGKEFRETLDALFWLGGALCCPA